MEKNSTEKNKIAEFDLENEKIKYTIPKFKGNSVYFARI